MGAYGKTRSASYPLPLGHIYTKVEQKLRIAVFHLSAKFQFANPNNFGENLYCPIDPLL